MQVRVMIFIKCQCVLVSVSDNFFIEYYSHTLISHPFA